MKRLFLTITLLAAFTVSLFSQALKVHYKDGKDSEIIINYASQYPITFRLDEDNELNIVFTTLDYWDDSKKDIPYRPYRSPDELPDDISFCH